MGRKYLSWIAVLLLAMTGLGGCAATVPTEALAMHPQTLAQRQLQTRRFATTDEATVLSACAGLLQDLGFNIESSETRLGLIVGSKDRDATDPGQVVTAIAIAVLFGAEVPIETHQNIAVSIVTHPGGNDMAVRVTFQRIVWNNHNQVSRLEQLNDPEMYQGFFDKLSKAIFLEAQEI